MCGERARVLTMSSAEVNDMVLKCEKTGKLFFTQAEAKQHGDDTGFAEFAQARRRCSNLRAVPHSSVVDPRPLIGSVTRGRCRWRRRSGSARRRRRSA